MIHDITNLRGTGDCWHKALSWLIAAVCLWIGSSAPAQDWRGQPENYHPVPTPQVISTPSSCSMPVRLPVVPTRDPRPATGSEPDQMWQTQNDPSTQPTASFIKAMNGNDAVIDLVLNQGRLLTLKGDISTEEGTGIIAAADPSIFDFDMLKPRIVRLTGRRVGATDLSIMTADGESYTFLVRVGYDLELLNARLAQTFPDAQIHLSQMREHLVVQGEARSVRQVDQILQTLEAFLESAQLPSATGGVGGRSAAGGGSLSDRRGEGNPESSAVRETPGFVPRMGADEISQRPRPEASDIAREEGRSGGSAGGASASARIINMLRIPGVHQVMLQVQLAEVNRTGLREIGADILRANPGVGNILATQIGGAAMSGSAIATSAGVTGTATGAMSPATQVFGVFPSGDFEILLRALRQNQLATVLAEPNLVAMSGQQASFLSGGEFPVPVPQNSGGGTTITVEFKPFGVQLDFIPYVLEDETIRLSVRPEASTIDDSVGAVINGFNVPGVNTRSVATTVEMRQGQTLGIAGLLTVTTVGTTSRIPLLGDLPYVGPMFSSTVHERIEKELLVLVTPYLVAPMNADQVPCLPGQEIEDPNDLEFYLLNRIEGRTGRGHDSSRNWDDPLGLVRLLHLEQRSVCGPVGFTSYE